MNILGEVRTDGQASLAHGSLFERALSPVESLAQHEGDRQRFGAMAVVLDYFPEREPFLLGQTWLALLVTPIPRWIWPAKVDFAPWRDIVFNLVGAPIPSSYPATLYANFSWIGVVLGMVLLGTLHHGAYKWLRQHPRDPSVVVLYAVFALFFDLTPLGVSTFLQYIAPALLAIWFSGRRIRAHPTCRVSARARPSGAPAAWTGAPPRAPR